MVVQVVVAEEADAVVGVVAEEAEGVGAGVDVVEAGRKLYWIPICSLLCFLGPLLVYYS